MKKPKSRTQIIRSPKKAYEKIMKATEPKCHKINKYRNFQLQPRDGVPIQNHYGTTVAYALPDVCKMAYDFLACFRK